jgi:arsenate reductase
MILYGLKACDTCRQALKSLLNEKVAFVDVRAEGVPKSLLEKAYAEFGDALINKSSTTWRGLNEMQRSLNPIILLQTHPVLMKRPLIVQGVNMTLGWKPDVNAQYIN